MKYAKITISNIGKIPVKNCPNVINAQTYALTDLRDVTVSLPQQFANYQNIRRCAISGNLILGSCYAGNQ